MPAVSAVWAGAVRAYTVTERLTEDTPIGNVRSTATGAKVPDARDPQIVENEASE
ncbi:hypothetical protein BSFA1_41810 [Burkholderia sp. SFA1]|nr:hypothetical protein BSFA1_41810 [Burkholderia sp. SFA1]